MATSDGEPFASGYDGSEMESEMAAWDTIKGAWDDVESHRVEEQTFVPMREACLTLASEAAELKSQVALLADELAEIDGM